MKILVDKLDPAARVPERAYEHAAGFDIYAFLLTESRQPSNVLIPPRHTIAVKTGIIVAISKGFHLEVCSRSGLAAHTPTIFVANAPGIIDPDYRGELKVLLFNGGSNLYTVRHDERIAQLIVRPNLHPPVVEMRLREETTLRGAKGFGSTGN
jgi:dUTP pyrophosphatase